jgi:hypothetical protein
VDHEQVAVRRLVAAERAQVADPAVPRGAVCRCTRGDDKRRQGDDESDSPLHNAGLTRASGAATAPQGRAVSTISDQRGIASQWPESGSAWMLHDVRDPAGDLNARPPRGEP